MVQSRKKSVALSTLGQKMHVTGIKLMKHMIFLIHRHLMANVISISSWCQGKDEPLKIYLIAFAVSSSFGSERRFLCISMYIIQISVRRWIVNLSLCSNIIERSTYKPGQTILVQREFILGKRKLKSGNVSVKCERFWSRAHVLQKLAAYIW